MPVGAEMRALLFSSLKGDFTRDTREHGWRSLDVGVRLDERRVTDDDVSLMMRITYQGCCWMMMLMIASKEQH
jgi:hypothetical protein